MSFEVEVVLTRPDAENLRMVRTSAEASTIAAVVSKSGLLELLDPNEISSLGFGVYGELRLPGDQVFPGDRVEIYRPLLVDPKTARRKRAIRSR